MICCDYGEGVETWREAGDCLAAQVGGRVPAVEPGRLSALLLVQLAGADGPAPRWQVDDVDLNRFVGLVGGRVLDGQAVEVAIPGIVDR